MDPFARIAENHHEMSDVERHLRLVKPPLPKVSSADGGSSSASSRVALLHEWRAAQIARSKAMHPSTLARAMAVPALRPLD
jgi:hypothetical protein